jgi:hypothetical protein
VDAALRQIQENRYADRYRESGKQIFLIGVNFNTETCNLEEWKIET